MKYIAGHTGKIEIETEEEAKRIARHNRFGKNMRAYRCNAGGTPHWHCTSMSKGRYYTAKIKDPVKPRRTFQYPME